MHLDNSGTQIKETVQTLKITPTTAAIFVSTRRHSIQDSGDNTMHVRTLQFSISFLSSLHSGCYS